MELTNLQLSELCSILSIMPYDNIRFNGEYIVVIDEMVESVFKWNYLDLKWELVDYNG